MTQKEIRVRTAAGEMRTFIVHPESGGPFPVAIVFMDGVGYREQVKENARRFAADGYYCVAPDFFYRLGDGVVMDFSRMSSGAMSDEDRQKMMKIVSSVSPDNAVADTRAVLDAIASDPAARGGPKVCVGYCMGARIALNVAAALGDEIVAAACIHPGPLVTDKPDSPHRDLSRVHGELYVAFAEVDRADTAEQAERFRQEMQPHGVRGSVERVPKVAHGFAMADLPVYNRDASERHFERTLELWRRNLSLEAVR